MLLENKNGKKLFNQPQQTKKRQILNLAQLPQQQVQQQTVVGIVSPMKQQQQDIIKLNANNNTIKSNIFFLNYLNLLYFE